MGGGLYEVLVIYPRWNKGVTPANLVQKLEDSGQLHADKFWVITSPTSALLSIINMVLAWQSTSEARTLWFTAALLIFLDRIITFVYFAPTMIRKFRHPENIDPEKLKSSVRTWTSLSPLRIPLAIIAWVLGFWTIYLLR